MSARTALPWCLGLALLCAGVALAPAADDEPKPLPDTTPLTMKGDIASDLVAGVDKFLLRKISDAAANREKFWKRDFSSPESYAKSIAPNRKRLASILGVRDLRPAQIDMEYLATTARPSLIGKGENYEVHAVR